MNEDQRSVKTSVVNVRLGQYDVYVGRPSKFGNPFVLMAGYTREEVVAKYRAKIEADPDMQRMAREELRGKRLGCWCRPPEGFQGRLMCHGQILAGVADGIPPESVE